MNNKTRNIALVSKAEIATMTTAMSIQNDIIGDTVTDDLYIPDGGQEVTAGQMVTIRMAVEHRIDVLVLITYMLAVLPLMNPEGDFIHLTDREYELLHYELEGYLAMIKDMVGEDLDGTTLNSRVQHIVDVNMLLLKFR